MSERIGNLLSEMQSVFGSGFGVLVESSINSEQEISLSLKEAGLPWRGGNIVKSVKPEEEPKKRQDPEKMRAKAKGRENFEKLAGGEGEKAKETLFGKGGGGGKEDLLAAIKDLVQKSKGGSDPHGPDKSQVASKLQKLLDPGSAAKQQSPGRDAKAIKSTGSTDTSSGEGGSHDPFKRHHSLGPGPRSGSLEKAKCWKCSCGNIYTDGCRCVGTGKDETCPEGHVKHTIVKYGWKQQYNHDFHGWEKKHGKNLSHRVHHGDMRHDPADDGSRVHHYSHPQHGSGQNNGPYPAEKKRLAGEG